MDGLKKYWATPLIKRVERSEKDPVHQALRRLILEIESRQSAKKDSPQPLHRNVYESEFDFLNYPDQAVLQLKQLIHRRLAETIMATSRIDQQTLVKFKITTESWFHVTRNGGYVRSHNHPQHSWSAIYCVDQGDPNPEYDHDAGYLVFSDPRSNAGMFLDMANSEMLPDLNFHAKRFRPKNGELIIFPSYIWHSVEPYNGERPRITVAANFRFNLPSDMNSAKVN